MIGPLPESKGNNAILVIVDRFSKKIEAIPTTTELTSKGVAELFRDHVFKHHGLPQKVISDQGPQFVSHFMTDLLILLGIKHNRSTAYHLQTVNSISPSNGRTNGMDKSGTRTVPENIY